jgi:hypothetical protein
MKHSQDFLLLNCHQAHSSPSAATTRILAICTWEKHFNVEFLKLNLFYAILLNFGSSNCTNLILLF